jgi:hypothetical protein
MALEPAIQELVDRAAIRDLMARYARGLDRLDLDLVASSFTTDAYVNYGTWEDTGVDNIVRRLRARVSRYDRSTHFMGDQVVRFNGDTADVETYALIYIVYSVEGNQYQSMGGIHYEDRMTRHGGGWQVQRRVVHHDWRRKARVDESVPGTERLPISE